MARCCRVPRTVTRIWTSFALVTRLLLISMDSLHVISISHRHSRLHLLLHVVTSIPILRSLSFSRSSVTACSSPTLLALHHMAMSLVPKLTFAQFLGVLLALIVLAAALTYRSYRIRRRYRTATQLAIARGDPIPPGIGWWGGDDDLWGLGVLRHPPGPLDRWAAVGRGPRRDRRWMPIPVLYDAVPEDEKEVVEDKGKGVEVDDLWDDVQVSDHSSPSHYGC